MSTTKHPYDADLEYDAPLTRFHLHGRVADLQAAVRGAANDFALGRISAGKLAELLACDHLHLFKQRAGAFDTGPTAAGRRAIGMPEPTVITKVEILGHPGEPVSAVCQLTGCQHFRMVEKTP